MLKRGAVAERITVSNMTIETSEGAPVNERLRNTIAPIAIDIETGHQAGVPLGKIRDLTLRDIHITSRHGSLIQGMPESHLENLTVENLTMRITGPAGYEHREKPSGGGGQTRKDLDIMRTPTWLALNHIDGFVIDGLRVFVDPATARQYDRSALHVRNSTWGTIRNVELIAGECPPGVPRTGNRMPVIDALNARALVLSGNRAMPGTPVFLGVRGAATEDITLTGNALQHAAQAVDRTADVPAGAVRLDQ
jgi:hypothetical protein